VATKQKPRGYSLRFSMSGSFIGTVLFTALLITIISSWFTSNFVMSTIRQRLGDIAVLGGQQISALSHDAILREGDEASENFAAVLSVLNRIQSVSSDIAYIYTLRKQTDGNIVFVVDADPDLESRAPIGYLLEEATDSVKRAFEPGAGVQVEESVYTDEWGTFITGYAPICRADGSVALVLGVDITVGTISKYRFTTVFSLVLVSLLVTIVAIFLSLGLSSRISRPVLRVTEDMQTIRQFNLSTVVDLHSSIYEIQNMVEALENMKRSLRSFKKYVPSEIVSDLVTSNKEAVLEAERRNITVFFSDIADFTTISEQLPPEALSKALGMYLSRMTKIIMNNKGTVDKFIGDAIMALWGAPQNVENHVLATCRAAIACQLDIEDLNRHFIATAIPVFNTRIGINTGEAIVGNMGYDERLSYTAIGDNVNLASRLEGLNKLYGTQILVSDAVANVVRGMMVLRLIDVVAVKGKHNGVRVYELIGEHDKQSEGLLAWVKAYNEAMEVYLSGQWQKAVSLFEELNVSGQGGRAAQIIIERCKQYMINDPGPDWTGVVTMREK